MFRQTVINTVAGRFLVAEPVVGLVRSLDSELRQNTEGGERYRIQRGLLEDLLARHGAPIRTVFVTPRTERELAAVS